MDLLVNRVCLFRNRKLMKKRLNPLRKRRKKKEAKMLRQVTQLYIFSDKKAKDDEMLIKAYDEIFKD